MARGGIVEHGTRGRQAGVAGPGGYIMPGSSVRVCGFRPFLGLKPSA